MKKLVFLSAILTLFISSCKEKDLTEDNPDLPEENVHVGVSFLYDEKGLSPDSIITNNLGNRFYVTEVKFLMSNFFIFSESDSIKAPDDVFKTFSLTNTSELIMLLPDGGYSGFYGFTVGLDSIYNYTIIPTDTDEDSGLRDEDIIRNDGFGYNSIVIKGRVFDPADPNDSIGKIPFEYQVGSELLSKNVRSNLTNFAVTSTTQVNFILNVDIEPIFSDFDITKRPTASTQVGNTVDIAIVTQIRDDIQISLF